MATPVGRGKDRRSLWIPGSSILWFDPRREHSSAPTAKSHSRRAQGLSRSAVAPPMPHALSFPGRALTGPSTAARSIGRVGGAQNLHRHGAHVQHTSPSTPSNPATAHKRPATSAESACKIIGKFKPLVLGEIHAAGDIKARGFNSAIQVQPRSGLPTLEKAGGARNKRVGRTKLIEERPRQVSFRSEGVAGGKPVE
jgi:hypothetical protein